MVPYKSDKMKLSFVKLTTLNNTQNCNHAILNGKISGGILVIAGKSTKISHFALCDISIAM